MRPWLAAILAPFALATMMVPLVAAEPHAHADATSDGFYIDLLKGTDIYDRYGEQTLLREAYKVCDAIQRGTGEESNTTWLSPTWASTTTGRSGLFLPSRSA